LLVAIPSIKLLYIIDGSNYLSKPVCIYKIIGHQWFWSYEFESLDGSVKFDCFLINVLDDGQLRLLETDNIVYLPVLKNLRLLITSTDVLHSWAVPSLGIKLDAIPGRINQVNIIINRIGDFYGQCSEICGINHGFMPIHVIGYNHEII